MTPHISAKKGEIAEIVIMPGDPLRVKYIAEKYLKNASLVNNIRLALAYTGTYEGKEVTVMASGMGMPSIAIYAHELFEFYDVKKIIRVGTCGSYYKEIDLRDVIVVEKAYTESNFAKTYNDDNSNIAKSSVVLSQKIVNAAHDNNLEIKIGTIHTTDAFYNKKVSTSVKENFCLAAEMECFALFYIAKHFDKQAAAILTVSDNLETKEELSSIDREQTFDQAIMLALDSIK